jgi:hypothetical protein
MTIQLRQRLPILPPRLVLYGTAKVGKSTFAAGATRPVFLPTEDGLGTLDVPVIAGEHGKLETWGDLHEALHVAEQSDAKVIVIDSITAAQDLCFAEVCRGESNAKSIADIPYGKGYPRALTLWLAFLARLDYARSLRKAIILIGHAQVETYADPEGEPYDRHALRLHQQSDGKPSLRAATTEWADVIAFAAQRVYKSKTGKGFDERTVAGGGERVLYTQPSPSRTTGSRYPMPSEMPLTWDAFIGAWKIAVEKARPAPTIEPPPSAPAPAPEPEPTAADLSQPTTTEPTTTPAIETA